LNIVSAAKLNKYYYWGTLISLMFLTTT